MAKLKVSGSASGTGTITLIAPATSTDRTITLPDESITLGGGVDGIVSTADATAITIDSSENVQVGGYTTDGTTNSLRIGNVADYQGRVWLNSADEKLTIENTSDYANGGVSIKTNGAERLKVTTDGRGLSQFTAKAWVKFNGAGTVSIMGSHNVSSITDNGTGDYYINFSNNMADTNYATMGNAQAGTGDNNDTRIVTIQDRNFTTSAVRVRVTYQNGGYLADHKVHAVVFGD